MNHGCTDTCCSPDKSKSLVWIRYIETAMHHDLVRYKGTRIVERKEERYVPFPLAFSPCWQGALASSFGQLEKHHLDLKVR